MMDSTDKEILNRIQREVPLEREPFEAIGRELGIAGDEVIRRIEALKRGRVIRQISAIFDTRVLGYESSLVAARIQAHKLGEGAKAINSHPGVSHNYERNNEFNLWYTVAVPPDSRLGLEGTVDVLHRISGAEKTRILPTLKLFKIGVTLDMNKGATAKKEAPQYGESDRESADKNISEDDKAAIRALQEDVPLTPRPFDLWGRQVGLSYEETGHTPSSPWSTVAASRSARTSSRPWPRRRDLQTTPPSTPPASTRRRGCATSRPRWRPGSASTQASCANQSYKPSAFGRQQQRGA
jgi:siroheme decarboxylase